ncbi:MAG: helix-turn-helix domain-containing protein [Solirubrobacterales bacterium]|nr:helix-turn-helix domain-containing protein [Thermoleophilales bacterium]MCO5325529.1 helix-turn-helix domain-containing protein [Solirubrobacterales bacterium]
MSTSDSPIGIGGQSLRAARRSAGLTQQDLAHKANCSLAYVRLLEGGYRPAKSAALTRIVAVLSILGDGEGSVEALLAGESGAP